MTPPVTYNPIATAMLQADQLVWTQEVTALRTPVEGLSEATAYPVRDVLEVLPAGPLQNSARIFAENPNVVVSYRLVPATDTGTLVPEYAFLSRAEAAAWNRPQVCTGGGGPEGQPRSGSVGISVGGVTLLMGTSLLLQDQGMPAPVVGPFMGTTWAVADGFTGMPQGSLNQFMRGSLTAMGSGTTLQYGWSYGFDALGVPMGSDVNTWGSVGMTVATYVPAFESFGTVANPFYSQTFARGFQSSIGVGLSGAGTSWIGQNIYYARGGPAGGAGFAGAGFQAVGAAGAVLMGSSLGGWVTEEWTGMNDENDDYGQLARLSRDRMYSDAWGGLGRSPLGHLMAGLTVAILGSDDFAEGLEYATRSIARDATDFAEQMDPVLLALILNNAPAEVGQPLALRDLESGIRSFYSEHATTMSRSHRVLGILRRTYQISAQDMGMTRFVDGSGGVTDEEGLTGYAADMSQRTLTNRTARLERRFAEMNLVLVNGQVAPSRGFQFTQPQIDFIRGEGAQLTYEVVRLTNALATLRPSAVGYN